MTTLDARTERVGNTNGEKMNAFCSRSLLAEIGRRMFTFKGKHRKKESVGRHFNWHSENQLHSLQLLTKNLGTETNCSCQFIKQVNDTILLAKIFILVYIKKIVIDYFL